jgi:DHA1 family bicyclomycin/chloramphenicol resistance-like MFS transporter
MKERQGRGEFVALMAAASATIAIAIDAMLPAFADVRDHFGLAATSSDAALIITVFMAGLGIGHFVYGSLADRFGRKPVFIAGLLLYIVAGFATAFASTLNTLLLGWFFWGLGAAGPRVVSQAMLRDRYRGDLLARAMAIILTIFLIVPTLAPVLGQALLHLGSWRYTFAVGPAFGTVVTLWPTRVTESLEESMRLPLDLRSIGRAAAEVLRTPTALGNTVALMMLTAAFLPYLASSERMYGEVYERGSQFFLWFAPTSVVMAGFTLATTTIVTRLGTRRTAMGALAPPRGSCGYQPGRYARGRRSSKLRILLQCHDAAGVAKHRADTAVDVTSSGRRGAYGRKPRLQPLGRSTSSERPCSRHSLTAPSRPQSRHSLSLAWRSA